jgi:hypothetical protein
MFEGTGLSPSNHPQGLVDPGIHTEFHSQFPDHITSVSGWFASEMALGKSSIRLHELVHGAREPCCRKLLLVSGKTGLLHVSGASEISCYV